VNAKICALFGQNESRFYFFCTTLDMTVAADSLFCFFSPHTSYGQD